jgi:thioredoxin-related protein
MKKLHALSFPQFVLVLVAVFLSLPASYAEQQNVPLGQYLGAKDATHPDWFKESFLDFEEDIDDAAANGKRLVLYFYQRGCPYCNELIENNFSQRDIAIRMQEDFDLVAINMWGDREVVQVGGKDFTEKTLALALRVNYTPTLMFFDESRNVVLRLDGYYPPDRFRTALEYVAGMHEKSGDFNTYLASARPASTSGTLNSEPFFQPPPFKLNQRQPGDERPLAVFFEQASCLECDTLHEKVLTDPSTRSKVEQFLSVQLDIWSDMPVTTPAGRDTTVREWAQSLGVAYAPSIVFFDTTGQEVMRMEAFLKTFHTQGVMAYVLEKGYESEPSFQRYLSARAEHLREQGIDVDIWDYTALKGPHAEKTHE